MSPIRIAQGMFREMMPHDTPREAPCFRSVAYRTFDMVSVRLHGPKLGLAIDGLRNARWFRRVDTRANRRRRDLIMMKKYFGPAGCRGVAGFKWNRGGAKPQL